METEVAVIGSGPAGCAAAIMLGRASISCTMFERGFPQKDKACGDAFMPEAVEALDSVGMTWSSILHLGSYRFSEVALHGAGTDPWRIKVGRAGGFVVRRALIDQQLRDIAARLSQIEYASQVNDIEVQSQRVRIVVRGKRPRFFAGVVIATGSGGRLAKNLNIDGNPIAAASISAYGKLKQSTGVNFLFQRPLYPGYGWYFSLDHDTVNLGICALRIANGAELRELASRFSERIGISTQSAWRGGLGALWSGRGRSWHHEGGVLSCGDAAGLVDPLTGEGITAALVSGMRAGQALAAFVKSGRDPELLRKYSTWAWTHFRNRYLQTAIRSLWPGFCGCSGSVRRVPVDGE